jgi:outer membrane receptor protein involved in Fe transport
LTAPVYRDWLLAGAEVQYMSERTTVEGLTLEDVWLVNATLFTNKFKGAWDISLSVYNLLNTSYRDPALTPDTVEQDGRT